MKKILSDPPLCGTLLISIGGRKKVNPQQVIALVASVNYSFAYMQDGRVIIVATPLKLLEKRFDSTSFFRSHKSFLINLKYVAEYDPKNLHFVEMKNNLRAMISRRKREGFKIEIQKINDSNM